MQGAEDRQRAGAVPLDISTRHAGADRSVDACGSILLHAGVHYLKASERMIGPAADDLISPRVAFSALRQRLAKPISNSRTFSCLLLCHLSFVRSNLILARRPGRVDACARQIRRFHPETTAARNSAGRQQPCCGAGELCLAPARADVPCL